MLTRAVLWWAGFGILKQKLVEYFQQTRQEPLEEYAEHRLHYMFSVYPEFQESSPDAASPPGFLNAVA